MLQILYWLGSFYKTIALLSLIIFIPSETNSKTLLSKGFLWLYMNEILYFFTSVLVSLTFSATQFTEYFHLVQLIMNVYFIVIALIVIAWLIGYRKDVVSKSIDPLSVVFIAFSWLALMIVGSYAIGSKDVSNMHDFANLSYGLAWVMGSLKFLIQYNLNKATKTFGLSYVYLLCNISWIICQSLYYLLQEQSSDTLTLTISTVLISVVMGWVNVVMIRQRMEIKKLTENLEHSNVSPFVSNNQFPIDQAEENIPKRHYKGLVRESNIDTTTLKDSLLEKSRKCTSTHYTGSFTDSIDDY